ncbi:ATP-binding protein [Streptomyces sp. NPDC005574]|uniref:ATP-binding protein n=1 Tax=Streptomyces sp. NPDC005574 TaxID=3156891 RepID=UPI0033A5D1A8
MPRRNAFRLPRHPASVGLARRRVRDHLTDWGHGPDDPALHDAVLLVSEAAGDAVRRGSAGARPQVVFAEAEFEVVVTALADGTCLPPRLRVIGASEDTDAGLHLVGKIAASWGVRGAGTHGGTAWALTHATP